MLYTPHKRDLPLDVRDGILGKTGGTAWVVYKFNKKQQEWIAFYWAV